MKPAVPAAALVLGVGIIVVAVALGTLGGDGDEDAESATTGEEARETLSEEDYIAAFAKSLEGTATGFDATREEAECAARGAVEALGADRMQAAGLTAEWFEAEPEATELTEDEATTIVDALYACFDVTKRFATAQVGENTTDAQSDCIGEDDTIRRFLPRVLREGPTAVLDAEEAGGFVDTLLECIPPGELFHASVAGSLTVTDEQVACLNQSLLSSGDYRDGLVQGITGEVTDTESTPPFADEIQQCVPLS